MNKHPHKINAAWSDVVKVNDYINNGIENAYFEYTWHKYFDNPTLQYSDWSGGELKFDDHWLIKYYLNFVQCKDIYKDKKVLDLGCGISFYHNWALATGSTFYCGVEPDLTRHNMNLELSRLRNTGTASKFVCTSAEDFLKYNTENYNLVLLSESLYYMHNQHQILSDIRSKVNPDYLIVESVVAADVSQHPQGLFTVDYTSYDTKDYDSYNSGVLPRLKIQPSRQAYNKMFDSTGWKVHSYYDFIDYQGKDFPTRSIQEYRKMFYVLVQQ